VLRFLEAFDHYTWAGGNPPTGDLLEKWTSWSASGGGGTTFAGPVTGRSGTGAQLSGNNIEVELGKTLDDQSTWVVGWAWRKNGAYSGNTPILKLLDSSGGTQLSVYHDGTSFHLYRGAGTTLLATSSPGLVTTSTWYYLEAKAVIANAGGSFELRLNGVTIATYSGDTQQHASLTTANHIRFGGDRTQTGTTIIDDIYVFDGVDSGISGCPNNDFIGDCKVETIRPNGAGASTVLTRGGTDSGANWSQVDETTPNDATDYVESATPGDKDTYAMGALATLTGLVYGVQACPNAGKSDAGARSICSVARLDSTEVDGATHVLGSTYAMYRHVFEPKPGGGRWTIDDVNAAEFGVKIVA
jgi:hypothetical protein